MKEKIIFAAKSILLLLIATGVGTMLLVVSYHFQVHTTNQMEAYEMQPKGGEYPRASELGSDLVYYFDSFFPDILDGGTDAIMLRTALDTSEGNALVRAMASHSNYMGDYCYYWHGYVSILRPLMRVFGLPELRILAVVFHVVLLVFGTALIVSQKGLRYGCMFLCSYFLLMPLALILSLQFSWVFYITFIAIIILFLKNKALVSGKRYIYFFILLGICTSYLDLLTYPLITWGMPLLWMIVVDETPRKEVEWVKRVVSSGIGWIFGYAGMWIMKWLIATWVLGYNVFESAINEVFLRAGTEENYSIWDRFQAIYENWRHYEYSLYVLLILAWVVWWLYQTISKGTWKYCEKKYAYGLIGVSAFVWYFVLANHTGIHHFFTYRIYGITLLAAMALMLESVPIQCHENKPSRKNTFFIFTAIMCAMVLAIPFVFLAREENSASNGYVEFNTVELKREETIECSFAPIHNQVTKINLGVQCDGTEGEYLITLWDGEQQIQQERYSISQSGGSNFGEIDVSWNLKKDRIYRMTIEVVGNTEPVHVWVTDDATMVLPEYGPVQIGQQELGGQILAGITYLSYPISKMQIAFLLASWFSAFMLIFYITQRRSKGI